MRKLILLYLTNPRTYIFSVILLLLFSLIISIQVKSYYSQTSTASIEPGYGYYSGDKVSKLKDETSITVINTLPFNSDLTKQTLPEQSNDVAVDISGLDYVNAPDEQMANNMGLLQSGEIAQKYSIIVSPFPDELAKFQVALESFNGERLFAGQYPTTEDEIAIPLNVALQIANDNNYNKYQKVIGKQITFNVLDQEVTKTISGIIGGTSFIAIDRDFVKISDGNAAIIEYNSENDIKRLEQNYNIDITTNADLKQSLPIYIIIEYALAALIYVYMMYSNFKLANQILNFYTYTKLNYLINGFGLIMPIVACILLFTLIS